jgi:hypothetical protein
MEQAVALGPVGPASESQIAHHLVRGGIIVAPLLILISGILGGSDGAVSAAYAIVCVLVNFALAAVLLTMAMFSAWRCWRLRFFS